jgi:hypothetical protein
MAAPVMRFSLLALILASGCIVEAPTSAGRSAAPVDRPPARPVEVRVGANFDDKLELTSAVLSNDQAFTGESLKVMLNLTVKAELGADYLVFVHAEDVDGKTERINVDHAPARGVTPTSKWKVGETVRDDFEIPVPPTMNVRGISLYLGFWDPKTDARLAVKNTNEVRTDGNNRLLVVQVPVRAQ